jgi:hypothetical protein
MEQEDQNKEEVVHTTVMILKVVMKGQEGAMEPRSTMVQVHLVFTMAPLLKLALEVEEGIMTPRNIVGLVAMVRIIPRLLK